jgi:hypothetical protein
LSGDRRNQFCDLTAAGAAVRARFETRSDRSDGRRLAEVGGRLQDLVTADVEAGADDRSAIARLGARPAQEHLQPFRRPDLRAETLNNPGPGDSDRTGGSKQRSGEGAIFKCDEAALAGCVIVIGDDVGALVERERSPRKISPIGWRRKPREFGAPASIDDLGRIIAIMSVGGRDRRRSHQSRIRCNACTGGAERGR